MNVWYFVQLHWDTAPLFCWMELIWVYAEVIRPSPEIVHFSIYQVIQRAEKTGTLVVYLSPQYETLILVHQTLTLDSSESIFWILELIQLWAGLVMAYPVNNRCKSSASITAVATFPSQYRPLMHTQHYLADCTCPCQYDYVTAANQRQPQQAEVWAKSRNTRDRPALLPSQVVKWKPSAFFHPDLQPRNNLQ